MDSAPRPRPFATDVRPRMPPQHPVTDSMHVGTLGGDPHVGHEASSHVVPEGVGLADGSPAISDPSRPVPARPRVADLASTDGRGVPGGGGL